MEIQRPTQGGESFLILGYNFFFLGLNTTNTWFFFKHDNHYSGCGYGCQIWHPFLYGILICMDRSLVEPQSGVQCKTKCALKKKKVMGIFSFSTK